MADSKDDKRPTLRPEIAGRGAERRAPVTGGGIPALFGWLVGVSGRAVLQHTGNLSAYQAWQQRRRALREGRLLQREAKRGLRRYGHQLEPASRERVTQSIRAFELATGQSGDAGHDALVDSVNDLDKVLDDYLSFARKSTSREYVEAIGTAVLIALFLRAFVVEAFKIPSGSMIPTLQVGDHIFVNKFLYGVRVPFTNVKVGTSVRKPRRGEVIVFIYPKDPDKDFIKRIVATEGETVQMRDGVLYVNNEAVPHRSPDAASASCVYDDYREELDVWEKRDCEINLETVNGVEYTTYHDPDLTSSGGPPHDTEPFVVPQHSVYVMGDNRDNSHDSRWWHEVPEDLIKGKAMVIWWSQGNPDAVSPDGPLAWLRNIPVLKILYGARYSRMFKLVR